MFKINSCFQPKSVFYDKCWVIEGFDDLLIVPLHTLSKRADEKLVKGLQGLFGFKFYI